MQLRSFSSQNYVPVNCILELKLLLIATNSGDPYTVGRVMWGWKKIDKLTSGRTLIFVKDE